MQWIRRNQRPIIQLMKYEGLLLLAALAISALTGRATLPRIGSMMALGGLLVIGFGAFAIYGTWAGTRSFRYQHAASASKSIKERFDDNQRDMREAYLFFLNCFIIGVIAVVIGLPLFFI